MRLRLLDRLRRLWRRTAPMPARSRRIPDGTPGRASSAPGPAGLHRRTPPRSPFADRGQAKLADDEQPLVGAGSSRHRGPARAAVRAAPGAPRTAPATAAQARRAVRARESRRPWYALAPGNRTAAGRRHCGHLETVVRREWAEDAVPPPEVVVAIERLAELPQLIKEKLVTGLDAIYVGPGGVPDLDDMGQLSGVPLPSGRATWDACAGAYGDRKIIVGSRPSPTPDVMCHEIGHALDDIDGADGQWQSDSDEFVALYEQCLPLVVSDFHKQRSVLGRREFFADAFAAIASSQRPALVDMLGGDTRAALNVMLYFNVRYGI